MIDVYTLLAARRIRQTDLARKIHVAKADLNKVIHRKRQTLHIRKKVADELGFSYAHLWGRKDEENSNG